MTVMTKKIVLRDQVRAAWRKACEHDGFPVDAQFVVFSDTNPFEAEYNAAMAEYLDYCRTVPV